MNDDTKIPAPTAPLLDRSDVRVKHATGIGGAVRSFLDRVRSGELGALPVVVGLVIIWTVFQTLNPIFLSSNNLVNLLFDSSTVGVISLGIVCILMVGEIDLSVGSVSGFASALVGVLWVNQGWPAGLAIVAAMAAGGAIGFLYSVLFNRFGMPSFVSTLAGLLAVLGLQLYILGQSGSINLPYESALVDFGQSLFMPPVVAYGVVVLFAVATLLSGIRTAARRQKAGLSARIACGRAVPEGGRSPPQVLAVAIIWYLKPGAWRAVDVRAVRRPCGDRHELCADPHQMGPVDEGGGRQPPKRRAVPASTCAADLHRAPSCCVPAFAALGGVLSSARSGVAPASRRAPAT